LLVPAGVGNVSKNHPIPYVCYLTDLLFGIYLAPQYLAIIS
jgi:hypothetical protein